MCGRYTLGAPAPIVEEHFERYFPLAIDPGAADWQPRYNLAPSQDLPVVRILGDEHRLSLLHWGLIPHWAKERKTRYHMINARAETVAGKPAYRDAFRRRRCLVPATGFYEWRTGAAGKQPWYFRLKDSELFAMAGLWEHWEGEGGPVDSFTIIVTDANERVRPIHDRMPVILAPQDYENWLDPDNRDRAALEALLKPFTAGAMDAWPVSRRVNSPRNDSPYLTSGVRLD